MQFWVDIVMPLTLHFAIDLSTLKCARKNCRGVMIRAMYWNIAQDRQNGQTINATGR